MANQIFGQENFSGHNYLAVNSDGSINIQAIDARIPALSATISGNIEDITELSAGLTNVTSTLETNSGNWDSTYSTVLANSSQWDEGGDVSALSAQIDINTSDIQTVSSQVDINTTNISNVTTTVSTNSADWGNHTDVTGLSSAIDANTIDISNVTTTVETNSASWSISANYDTEIDALSSAIDGNTGNITINTSDIQTVSSQVDINTQSISNVTSTVETNSADWGNHSDYDTEINALSSAIDINITDISNVTTTVETNSATWGAGGSVSGYMPLSGGEFTGAVSGITPVLDNELTTKSYVDSVSPSIDYDNSVSTNDYTVTTSWANVGNGMTLTAPSAGVYKVTACVIWKIFGDAIEAAGGACRFHNGSVQKGSIVARNDYDPVTTDWNTTLLITMTICDIFSCTNGETINLQAIKFDSASTVSIFDAVFGKNTIMMEKLSD